MSAATTYAPDRIGYRYGVPDDAYSKGYHRGQDVRELNADETASVVTAVDAIDDGTVAYVGIPNGLLRRTVVIDTGRARGRYESHSHLADISVSVGQHVVSGQRIARNAAMNEGPGMVTAPHDHVTITDYLGGAWETWRDEYDPLPFMQAAYQRAKGADMPLNENDQKWLNGLGSSIIDQVLAGVGKRVWDTPIQAQDANGVYITRNGQPVTYPAKGFEASTNAQIGALRETVKLLAAGTGLDPKVIEEAAEKGARAALEGLTLRAS